MSEDQNKAKDLENPKTNSSDKSEVANQEEEVLQFWQENKIFEKSLEKPSPNGEFVFYDGPPFATGLPHYGHLLAGTMKDIIPRYQTMKGKKVSRRWGWDCHGLPIENLIEKELDFKTKGDILKYGVENFNEAAKQSVLRYDVDWKKIVPRTGRWVDMKSSYQTMDTSYSESIWHIFKDIYDKKLIYEGHKAMHLCPRCETTLSNFEVNQGYKDIKDLTATVKFELTHTNNTNDANDTNNTNPKNYILAWTTTPWTLPGNVALAVNPDIDYIKIKYDDVRLEISSSDINNGKREINKQTSILPGVYILAKNRLEKVFSGFEYKVIEEFKGSDLIGKSYKPLFDYYSKDENLENHERGWKIYGVDFVTTEDGTGVVHIAPAFGSDDMELGKKENLPFIQHVSVDGKFKPEVGDGLAGKFVKPKDNKEAGADHMDTDIEMIKLLVGKGVLFSKEKVEHSYPHCWRCDTPLLNYATSSWFLKVTGIKDEMIKANSQVNWVPENIRDGRFGKWLEGARDWAISRTRFWGAPLPVWKCDRCEKVEVLGSIKDLKNKIEKKNNIFVMRHGEADNNVKNVISTQKLNNHHLTKKGKVQVSKAIQDLKKDNIDLIISSPYVRTKETAELVAEGLGLQKESVIFDDRVGEINLGDLEGKSVEEYHNYFGSQIEKFTKNPMNGETLADVKKRVGEFLYEINDKYEGKNILVVSHEYPVWMMLTAADALTDTQSVAKKETENLVQNAQVIDLDFKKLPHNKDFQIDLHMPYIDDVKFACSCGGEMKRIPEVFDCWFESGAMPYASNHYPFENLDKFNPEKGIGFPADFIAEGLDQTRGWFYTSLVLATALFNKTSYKNVIVNGLILAEDGRKMSKSLKNYPDPVFVLNKYGADALRYYLVSSPVVRAEDLNFSEKGVDEVLKKIILKVKNVVSFYELYKNKDLQARPVSENVLDKWIVARLNQLNAEITKGLDNYELDRASRPIIDFVDDLSTWYIRRSRDRFKQSQMHADSTQIDADNDRDFALATTQFVLIEFSKLIAPFMPFLAEEVWGTLMHADKTQMLADSVVSARNEAERSDVVVQSLSSVSASDSVADQENNLSVHLQDWPKITEVDEKVLEDMKKVREIVSLALEARAKNGIKVRQPLNQLTACSQQLTAMNEQLIDVIKDEVNVKKVVFEKGDEDKVELDTEITSELKAEGQYRELLRNIQRMRKDTSLVPSDVVDLIIETDESGKELVKKFEYDLKKIAGVRNIKFEEVNDVEETKIDNLSFKIKI